MCSAGVRARRAYALHPAPTWPRRRAPHEPRWCATGVHRDLHRHHWASSPRGLPPLRRKMRAARRQRGEGRAAASAACVSRRASAGSLSLTPGAAEPAAGKRTPLCCGDGGDGSRVDESEQTVAGNDKKSRCAHVSTHASLSRALKPMIHHRPLAHYRRAPTEVPVLAWMPSRTKKEPPIPRTPRAQ